MNEKNKPVLIGILVLAVVVVGAVFLHARMSAGAAEKAVIVTPDSSAAAPRPAETAPVTSSAN